MSRSEPALRGIAGVAPLRTAALGLMVAALGLQAGGEAVRAQTSYQRGQNVSPASW